MGQYGTSLIKLIWATFWGDPDYVRSPVWGNLELLLLN